MYVASNNKMYRVVLKYQMTQYKTMKIWQKQKKKKNWKQVYQLDSRQNNKTTIIRINMSIIFYIVHDGRQYQNMSQYIKSSLEIY